MKLTMNIIGDSGGVTEGSKNFILSSLFIADNPNHIMFRNDFYRYLTVWDVTTDMMPQDNIRLNQTIKIVEWGSYDNEVYTPEGNTTLIYNTDTSSYLEVNDEIPVADLSFHLQQGKYRIYFDDIYLWNYKYLKFMYSSDPSKVHTLFIYRGDRVPFPVSFANLKIAEVPEDTIIPITMDMFDNFDYQKQVSQAQIQTSVGSNIYEQLTEYYGEPTGDKYLKIYLLNNNYQPNYPSLVPIPNLTYMGQPVFYGQALSWKDIQYGGLLLNTTGITGSYTLNIGVEGFISGRIHLEI